MTIHLTEVLLLFGVGTVAGLINVTAGGGSALSLPTLIFLGLDAALANGTNRIAIIIQNIFAILSFRQQKMHHFRLSLKLALWTLPGGILGAILAVRIGDEWFMRILGIVLIGVVLSMIFPPRRQENPASPRRPAWLVYPALLLVGFYGGFIQVGVGFLLMAALFHLLALNLVQVNMHKVFIVFIYTIPALAIFIASGNVNWPLGLSLAAGNSFGGWWAARLQVQRGEKLVRIMLVAALMIMALKLLHG